MSEKTKISVNLDELTFGEMELFEKVTGLIMSEAVKSSIVRDADGRPVPDPDDAKGRPLQEIKMSAKALLGMVYIAMHRENSDITLEDVRNMKMSDIDLDVVEDNEDESGKEPA